MQQRLSAEILIKCFSTKHLVAATVTDYHEIYTPNGKYINANACQTLMWVCHMTGSFPQPPHSNSQPPIILMREGCQNGSRSSMSIGARSGFRPCECAQILSCRSKFVMMTFQQQSPGIFFLCVPRLWCSPKHLHVIAASDRSSRSHFIKLCL